ncbi:hypothetical protein D3C86_1148940 [compost metagenome]
MKKIQRSRYVKIIDIIDKSDFVIRRTINFLHILIILLFIEFIWSDEYIFIKIALTTLLISFIFSYTKGFLKAMKEDYEDYEIID